MHIQTLAQSVLCKCNHPSYLVDDADSSEQDTVGATPAVSAEDDDDSDAPLVLKVLPSSVTAES